MSCGKAYGLGLETYLLSRLLRQRPPLLPLEEETYITQNRPTWITSMPVCFDMSHSYRTNIPLFDICLDVILLALIKHRPGAHFPKSTISFSTIASMPDDCHSCTQPLSQTPRWVSWKPHNKCTFPWCRPRYSHNVERSRFIPQHFRQLLLHLISEEVITVTLLVVVHLQAYVLLCHEAQEVQPLSDSLLVVLGKYRSVKLFVFWIGLYHSKIYLCLSVLSVGVPNIYLWKPPQILYNPNFLHAKCHTLAIGSHITSSG